MRKYTNKVDNDPDWGPVTIELDENMDRQAFRKEHYYHSEDTSCWAKMVDGDLYRSNDDAFTTERGDATHVVIYLK